MVMGRYLFLSGSGDATLGARGCSVMPGHSWAGSGTRRLQWHGTIWCLL